MDRKWTNWVTFGSVLMMIVGAFKLISGIIGLFRDEWLVLGYNGYMLVDITGLAVWYICVGALLFLGGIAALQGSKLGRVVGAIAAGLAAISEFFMIPYYPIWSIIMLVLYVIILVAFIAWKGPSPYGSEEVPVTAAAPTITPESAPVAPPCRRRGGSGRRRECCSRRRWPRSSPTAPAAAAPVVAPAAESVSEEQAARRAIRPDGHRGHRSRLRGEARRHRSQDHRRPAECGRQPEGPGGPGGGHGHQRHC